MEIPEYNQDSTHDDYLITEAESQQLIEDLWLLTEPAASERIQ